MSSLSPPNFFMVSKPLIGSFICGCNTTGYTLDDDGITCHCMEKLYIAFNHTYKHKYVAGFY